jgi:hypothetical protein
MSVRTALFYRRGGGANVAIDDMTRGTGNRFYVHKGTGVDGTAYGFSYDKPFATLDYAVGMCTASKGDIIYLMPGHTETVIAATTLTLDVIGIQVIGLGTGRLRPQITVSTATTATVNITAANILLKNVDIITNFLNVAAAMTVGADADGLVLDGVNFYDTSVILGALIGISVAAGCADLTIRNCKYYGIALTAAATSCIVCAGAADRLVLDNLYLKGDFSTGCVTATAAASVAIALRNLMLINMSETGKGVNLHASTTGVAENVQAYLEDQTGNEKAITGAKILMPTTVRQTNVVTASTYICLAAADS